MISQEKCTCHWLGHARVDPRPTSARVILTNKTCKSRETNKQFLWNWRNPLTLANLDFLQCLSSIWRLSDFILQVAIQVATATILDKINNLTPPPPPNQRWENGAFYRLCSFILDLCGMGVCCSFYSVQDCRSQVVGQYSWHFLERCNSVSLSIPVRKVVQLTI